MLQTEFEATFANIDKDFIRNLIREKGGELVKKEFTQKRKVFNFPESNINKDGFVRVRDEDGKITMTLKIFKGINIEDQKEAEVVVSDFNTAALILSELGAREKAFQETKRELWKINGVEIMIDTWPFLETFIEIEGKNEEDVRYVSERLNFNWEDAVFAPVTELYKRKYNISEDRINNDTPKIVFDMENPFTS